MSDTIKWWLVYGSVRTGTTLLCRQIASCSRRQISDWGLWPTVFLEVHEADYVKFDKERAYRDMSSNLLDNAYKTGGTQLDLVYKQANMEFVEYEALKRLWGEPEKTIFCIRDPAGYIVSAEKKFPEWTDQQREEWYVRNFDVYEKIGGDIFEYHPDLTSEDIVSFIHPLQIDKNDRIAFQYRGAMDSSKTTALMCSSFDKFKETYQDIINL